ncbi:uncharacterized protein F4807DRAFT_97731 [Annulohypoxylon truncatum]|uniref:uncharacterized protein n=1 Tax=Annulohypoxylon truncatum TaxID=327061 RepID=UPI002007D74B|nr:uncharacterized protein F4807DRAFT_97731 [Annulohypoxylon truncatum]KAI1209587.1 hypothetical protein F4807DRAFT_97731 [Annulohypoxylon truncatum]
MMDCTASRKPSLTTLDIFHRNLATQWKFKAYCGREYYRTPEIVKWMLRRDTAEPATNVGLLLTEVYHQSASIHHPTSGRICDEGDRCLIVFAILLELHYGCLIDVFQRYKIIDRRLPVREIYTNLLENDLRKRGIQNTKNFWQRFLEKMWMYYPCPLELGMRDTFLDPGRGRWIMPFCKRQRINMKGGTAEVWEVAVQEWLVPRKLAMAAGRSEYRDNEHGPCYVFALKTFTQESLEIFEWERDAYLAVQAKRLPGMVRFLGEYEIDEQLEDGSVCHTWNILLEYGEEDLDEFFASRRNYPPNLNPETLQFWNSLANVAQALDSVHNLELERENGRHDYFSGCHCDLKPDNILRVDGEFKLADFGFAKFKPKNPGGVPKQYIPGGTATYGAPECDRARLDPTISVSQAIDTWSFGCVLSVSATWVILGYQGIRAYDELRRIAIKKLRERREAGEDVTVPAVDDAFHNGVDVLPEVRDWHRYLRKVLRVADTITGRILDLVDETMLLGESAHQSRSSTLYSAIQSRLNDAQDLYDRLVKDGELEQVAESVKEALLSVENEESSLVNSHALDVNVPALSASQYLPNPAERHPRLKSSRINKSKRINEVIQGRVAHRQEALREQRSTTTQASQANSEKDSRYSETENSSMLPLISSQMGPRGRESSASYNSTGSTPYLLEPSAIPKPLRISNEKEVLTLDSPESPTLSRTLHMDSVHPRYGNSLIESPDREEFHLGTRLQLEEHPPTTKEARSSTMPGMEPYSSRHNSLISSPSYQCNPNPQWPIHQEHQALKTKEKGLRAFFPKKQDEYLKKFLYDRDIMFLVDNDMTMLPLWETMTTVLETLVAKIGQLDKNGLDLEFTLGNIHNAYNVPGKQLLAKFKDAKNDALSQQYHINTNMAKTLTRIFDKYLSDTTRAKTLIVLTNGLWRGTVNPTDVEVAIADFLRKPALAQKLEKRWFTIQFIACGSEVPSILKHLDDNIENKYLIPDVIDTEHISGNVYKMILGSFVDEYDVVASSQAPPTPSTNASPPGLASTHAASPSTPSPRTRPNSFRATRTLSTIKNMFN